MMPSVDHQSVAPVQKTITVRAGVERAFRVFTDGIDTWWPRGHHIGSAPAKKFVVEGRADGRCYTEQTAAACTRWHGLRPPPGSSASRRPTGAPGAGSEVRPGWHGQSARQDWAARRPW